MINRIKGVLLENRTEKQTIIKNTFWLLSAEGISKLLMVILVIVIARHIGVEGYGTFSFAFAFASLFSIIVDFGFSTLTIRDVSRDKTLSKDYLEGVTAIKLILSVITFFLIIVITLFIKKSFETSLLIYLFSIYFIFNSFNDFFRSIFKAFEKMQYEAYSKIIQGLALFVITILLISMGYGVLFIAGAYIISAIFGLFSTLFLLFVKFSRFNPKLKLTLSKKLIKNAWPFALGGLFMIVYFKIDTIMLGIFSDEYAVGIYSSAYNIIFLLLTSASLLNLSFYPYLSKNKNIKIKKIINYYFIGSFLVACLIYLISPFIISLYGPEFLESAKALRYLGIVLIFLIPNSFIGIYNASKNRQKFNLKVTGLLSIINILLNIMLIPLFSYTGAIISTIFTEIIGTILLYGRVLKEKNVESTNPI